MKDRHNNFLVDTVSKNLLVVSSSRNLLLCASFHFLHISVFSLSQFHKQWVTKFHPLFLLRNWESELTIIAPFSPSKAFSASLSRFSLIQVKNLKLTRNEQNFERKKNLSIRQNFALFFVFWIKWSNDAFLFFRVKNHFKI